MSGARRFLFGEDLSQPAQERRVADEARRASDRAALERAEQDGFARGVAAGRAEAEAETARRHVEAIERMAFAAADCFAAVDREAEAVEQDAMVFFEALARQLAGRAVADQPLSRIAEAATEAFRHLRGIPHLAVRVHESLVEEVDATLRAIARDRGFEGRVIVIGSEEIARGDARLDWADGGVVADSQALQDAVAAALAQAGALTGDRT